MREMLNYFIEVNIALLIFLAFYKLVLEKESQFRFQRIFMLGAIALSLILPFIDFTSNELQLPNLEQALPAYFLPEMGMVSDAATKAIDADDRAAGFWQVAAWVYMTGVIVFGVWLIMQLGYVWITVRNHHSYALKKLRVVESSEDKPTFSFFNLIYIGKANELTAIEKEQIIRHESEHARQLHSIDILIVTILGIIFWFNPFIRTYKKIFIQLHEFEADARAVENSDLNNYCSLLARVALQQHFPIASHFNESLTVKRIEMIRRVKTKMRGWKFAASALIVAVCVTVIACQDQIAEEVANSTISQSGDYPPEVRKVMDDYMKEHPEAKLTYMDGEPAEVEKLASNADIKSRIVYTFDLNRDGVEKKGLLLTNVTQYAESLTVDDKVFMVVEQMPEYPGGMDALKSFIRSNLRYPESARQRGIEGNVFISMIIDQSGAVTDAKIQKGISADADNEALRVIKLLPNWKPATQNGKAVKVRYIIPVRFDLNNSSMIEDELIEVPVETMKAVGVSKEKRGKSTYIVGRILSEGEPLPGANVVVAGTTSGATTDSQGNFSILTEKESGTLIASFIGYSSLELSF